MSQGRYSEGRSCGIRVLLKGFKQLGHMIKFLFSDDHPVKQVEHVWKKLIMDIYGGHLQKVLQESAIDNSILARVATVEQIWR